MLNNVIRCASAEPALIHTIPDKIISGEPVKKWQDLYVDPTGQFCVGIWESDKGKWEKEFIEDEFIYIISGVITLTDADGIPHTFGPGESLIVKKGFKGTWETVEPVKKWYASFEQKLFPRNDA